MTAYHPRADSGPAVANGAAHHRAARVAIDLQESLAHLHPLQRQHAIQLHQQRQQEKQQQATTQQNSSQSAVDHKPQRRSPPAAPVAPPQVQTTASSRARCRFVNLRDSVKKSPTKTTAKVNSCQQQGVGRPHIPWVPFRFSKVPPPATTPNAQPPRRAGVLPCPEASGLEEGGGWRLATDPQCDFL